MAPKRPILASQCEMDHQKPSILLIFSTLSLGGCGGHPTRPKLNLKDKSQMSTPDEYTDNFKSNLTCIFLSVRAKFKKPLCPRTLCKWTFICFQEVIHLLCLLKHLYSWIAKFKHFAPKLISVWISLHLKWWVRITSKYFITTIKILPCVKE